MEIHPRRAILMQTRGTVISKYIGKACLCGFLVLAATGLPCSAEERTLTPEQMEALANSGDFAEGEETKRPKNMPDLTKGGVLPGGKSAPPVWTLGPTGIVCQMSGREKGDQILVRGTVAGSPSSGKFLPGDVIIGMNGSKFVAGGHMGVLIGNAILAAELEENAGKISFLVWRDKNHLARSGKQDVAGVDIDALIKDTENDTSLYDWKPAKEQAAEVRQMGFDKFPIDPVMLEIGLVLRTFPAYADSAPYDCPKTKQILEEAWKALENKFVVDPKKPGSGKGGSIEAIALVASGKPEHRKLVYDWVRGPNSPWKPPTEPIGARFQPGYKGHNGYQSWHHGFGGLECALYYDATGDDYVLPALRKYAIETAMGQSWLGSWGHTFAFPSFNGGKLHQMNPGYGALNAAGNRCFFLIVLAKKLGVEHPEIDAAIERARRFFGSYTDKGCIPYGDHPAAASDDSNGKNAGVAFAMKLLGDNYKAKYFAMMSSHCAFTRRGGHGHDYTGEWSSWSATLCGPEVRQLNERNLRWRRALCRLHDGSFVYNSPTSYGTLRDPTATEVLHQSVIFGKTLITGKDADSSLYPNEREMKQLIASARGQFNDPVLLKKAGTPWLERSTDEVFDMLDIFFPNARASAARELGKRYQAGEKDILVRLLPLLESPEPRFRAGSLLALEACGKDAVLSSLSKVSKLLFDPEEFVRITAVRVLSKATDDKDTQLALLQATAQEPKSSAPNSLRNLTQDVLFGKDTPLANTPFSAGFDPGLVGKALEDLLLTDPGGANFLGSRMKVWTKDTLLPIAGPLTFIAEEEQIADQMFGSRAVPARNLLAKFGYFEASESSIHLLRKKAELPRPIRAHVGYKDPLVDAFVVNANPAAFRGLEHLFHSALTDNPNEKITIMDDRTGWLRQTFRVEDLLASIASSNPAPKGPSLADEVKAAFRKELAALDGSDARIKACRAELAGPSRKNTFRKIAAMDALVELLPSEAPADLAPYLGHDYWRLRDHSRTLAVGLAKAGGPAEWMALLGQADDPATKAGILSVLASSGIKAALSPARLSLKDGSDAVRIAAFRVLCTLGGNDALPEVMAHLSAQRDRNELSGCEEALLIGTDDPKRAAAVRDALLDILPSLDAAVKPSAWYVLSRLGDVQSIAALRDAAKTKSATELGEVVLALSYSPSREADRVLLDIAASEKKAADIVGPVAVRRMVLGPKGFGDITNSERMDFAEPMIKHSMDQGMVTYLAGVLDARALRALLYCLQHGVASAAESIVSNAERIETLSKEDNQVAVETIRNVIEFIEVSHLRGGVEAHMDKESNYAKWKSLQARAGKALLKFHKPEADPIPTFDSLDLDR